MSHKLNLVLHCGGTEVTTDQLAKVKTPDPTTTWCPIPHDLLLTKIKKTLVANGMSIQNEAHGLAGDGARYFGLLQVGRPAGEWGDYGIVVGVRNSHDMTFPAALALGSGVFVCDNLAFSGEIKLSRKHTRFIRRDLDGLVNRAIGQLGAHRHKQDRRIEAYRKFSLDGVQGEVQVNNIIINALDAGVVPASKIPHVLEEWRNPSHDQFQPRTAWSLFNSFTEVAKGNATLCLPRTQALHGLMDSLCGLTLSTSA